jgi:hypothetical protein
MFRWLRKRRAIRTYQRELGPQLRAAYGEKRHYTREEVFGTVRAGGLSEEFDCFALAMYCERVEFDAYHQAAGLACDYGAMRADAGCAAFDGAPMVDVSTRDSSHDHATSHDHGHATSHGAHHGSWLDVFHGGGGHDGGGGGGHDGGGGGHDGGGDFGGGHHGH